MGNAITGSEVVEIGIQIEKNGRDFYRFLSNNSSSPKAKAVFLFLSGEEERHIKAFEGILAKIAKYEPQGLDADEYYSYINALAAEHIFTQKDKGEEVAKSIRSDKEAVIKAIGFEGDSIVFYEGIKKVVPVYDQNTIDELILQEQNHLKQLLEIKNAI